MNRNTLNTIIKILALFSFLYLFLVGINGMSSAIKHMGGGFAKQVLETTSNPFTALFIGILATSLFQSSSTTTSIIVSMVSASAITGTGLTLSNAIPMIMGANIGTTVTNTIVSIGHIRQNTEFKRAFSASTVHDFFNVMAVIILFPLEMSFHFIEKSAVFIGSILSGHASAGEVFKSPIKVAVKTGAKFIEGFSFDNNIFYLVLSVLVTFLMLYAIVKLLKSLVLAKIESFFDRYIFKTAIRAILFGIILTIMVQSSSVTTSLVVPLAGAGVLSLRQIFPYTLGANIGTTVTALLASLTLNVTALYAALAHLLFNIFGILIIYTIPLLRAVPLWCAETLSELSVKNKFIPLIYLLVVFVIIPITIIFIGG
ncbi:MAG: Na/Pi cotransporter family protein [Candidatus Marinimicrobia bacterium]|nr:Na/Pi cotransporter family protein [Candidatus Neomarinimicrobiota bacterium]MBL7023708.1 Na/Pi cotransporter family protein [Candidatus Neomarinimicrobiota bacterium]MBL7109995.1 Na/Pi cotransporter family protein [Candidatus Neomarinimicrobiota bacterium]